jgi:hypothetical protein
MSIFKAGIVLVAAIMLLPVEEKNQAQLASTASHTAERTASFCERNPSTCATGRDLWAVFLRKAEFGMELGARLLREHLLRASEEQKPAPTAPSERKAAAAALAPVTSVTPATPMAPVAPVAAQPSRLELPPPASRRTNYTMDHPSRWR